MEQIVARLLQDFELSKREESATGTENGREVDFQSAP